MNSPSSSETIDQPILRCRFSESGLVLRGDEDAAQPGVDAVAENEIDNPVRAAEEDGRLRPIPVNG